MRKIFFAGFLSVLVFIIFGCGGGGSSSSNPTVSGQVTMNGAGLSGVSVTLTGTGYSTVQTNSNGVFTFTNVQNGSYSLSAAMTGYTMSDTQLFTVNVANVSGITFTATAVQLGEIITVAGDGTEGYSGNNGAATSASLHHPDSVAVDSAGNIYIADCFNNRIRKVTAGTWIITTVAGSESQGYSGDNGAATSASLNNPQGVAVDSAGNIYVADTFNFRIRKVAAGTGIITTVAGNGTQGYSGDNGAATSAGLNLPQGVTVDSAGNIYIADSANSRIRKVTAGTGIITTVAGNGTHGYSGDNGAATSASLSQPIDVAVDSTGNIYIADYSDCVIREVAAGTGIITTVAGNGIVGYSGDNGAATSASLSGPYGVVVDSAGNIYIADTGNNRIRKVGAGTGIITTVAGNGTQGYAGDNGVATSANLFLPQGLAMDIAGNIYITDTGNARIREVIMGN